MRSEGITGLTVAVSDGADLPLRMGRTRELIKTDARGRYAESTSRGFTFSAMTAVTGTTIVAANNSAIAAAAATILSIYNPMGSGVNAEVLKIWLSLISGTPAAGMFVLNNSFGQLISAASNNGGTAGAMPQSNVIGATGKVKVYTQTALTGGVGAQSIVRPITTFFAGAAALSSPSLNVLDLSDGDLLVPPGGILSIASPGTGTTVVVTAGMTWNESPIQSL